MITASLSLAIPAAKRNVEKPSQLLKTVTSGLSAPDGQTSRHRRQEQAQRAPHKPGQAPICRGAKLPIPRSQPQRETTPRPKFPTGPGADAYPASPQHPSAPHPAPPAQGGRQSCSASRSQRSNSMAPTRFAKPPGSKAPSPDQESEFPGLHSESHGNSKR